MVAMVRAAGARVRSSNSTAMLRRTARRPRWVSGALITGERSNAPRRAHTTRSSPHPNSSTTRIRSLRCRPSPRRSRCSNHVRSRAGRPQGPDSPRARVGQFDRREKADGSREAGDRKVGLAAHRVDDAVLENLGESGLSVPPAYQMALSIDEPTGGKWWFNRAEVGPYRRKLFQSLGCEPPAK